MSAPSHRFLWIALLLSTCLSEVVYCQVEKTTGWRVERINQLVEAVWNDYDLSPSEPATDAEWCRRVFLDLIGRIPSVDELDAFVQDKSDGKRAKLVDDLVNADRYTGEFARNWTTIWTNLLIGRTGGNANNSLISRRGMQKFLRDSFARNKPYDRFATELVTATGTTEPGAEEFNGAVNFLIDKVNAEKATQATAVSSRLFLGLQVQCTQCHNHPFNDWKQQKYWEMNAFFRQVRAFRGGMRRADDGPARLADQDFGGEGGRNLEKPPTFYEMRNGEMRVAYPVFIDGTAIDPSGYVKAVNRREEFARLMVQSEYFPQALANRMWSHFLGYGFTSPVDDLGPHNPSTNPELLGFLAEEFRNTGFDIRQLMSWIVLSRPYGLSSKVGKRNRDDDPLLGESPKFSRFYLRQMRAEELYESLQVATRAGQSQQNYDQQERLKNRWLQQFSQAFGTDEGDETTSFNGTIPQVLMMFNGEMIRNATAGRENMIQQLVTRSNLNFKDQVTYLFKAGLSRRPKRTELQMAVEFLNIYDGDSYKALQDVWWVVLNSNEFIFNH